MYTQVRLPFTARHLFAFFFSTIVMFGVALAATASGPVAPDNPDMPPFAFSGSEADIIRQREAHVALLRGLPYADPGVRTRAIEQLTQAERARDRIRSPLAPSTLNPWVPIGPAPIPNGQTSTRIDPVSGRVTAIAVDQTDANIVYAGTAQGGLYRSLDGGATWTALMDSARSLAIGAVTVDPLDHTIVFVGTGEGNLSLDSFFGVGLYRITSANTAPVVTGPFETRVAGTGTSASNGHAFNGTAINKIVVDPANDNRIFVGNTTGASGLSGDGICCGGTTPPSAFIGLYFSENALAGTPTFSRVAVSGSFNGLQGVTDAVFEPGSSNNLLIGVFDLGGVSLSGIWRSTNAAAATGATSPTFSQVVVLGVVGSKLAINKVGSTVTVLAATGTSNGRLLKSIDGGATFPTTLLAVNGFCGGQCYYDIAVAMDPGNANNILIGGSAGTFILRKSTDGATFPSSQVGLHADVHAITIAPSNAAIAYHGNDGGIWRSADSGTTWTSKNNSTFSATQFQSIAVHPLDRYFTIGGTQDNGTECFGPCNQVGNSWIRADFGDGGFALIDQNATNTSSVTMYHTYFNQTNAMGYGRVTSSASATDSGWSFYGCGFGGAIPNNMTCAATKIGFYAPMALGPGNPNTLYFGSDVLYRSSNAGVTMAKVSQEPLVSGVAISAIGISPQNDNVRIVGLKDGTVWATTSGSSMLVEVDTLAMPSAYVARAVIDPTNANTAYVTFDGYGLAAGQHVWKTTDLNLATPTWTAAGGTGVNVIPDVPTNAFVIDPQNSNNLYAGTDIGVYQSTDGGVNWSPYGTGLPRVAVFDMAIQNPNRILRIATHGKGMWEISLLSLAEKLYLPLVVR